MPYSTPLPIPPESDMQSLTATRARKPRANRRQRVPPALTRGSDGVQAISILDEIPGDLGLVLWRAARNVALWAETPPERRSELFAGAAARARGDELARVDVPAELRGPVSVVAELLAHPDQADVFRLVNACRRISLWAEQRSSLATAIEFAQAAAQASPDSASLAYGVGRLARRRAEYDRAESWYGRAAVQGRASGDWRSYALAFSGMGNVHWERGKYPVARKWHLRCLRASERHGLLDLMGDSFHALFTLDVEMGAGFDADALAARAFSAYGPRNPKVLRLAYDVAYHWTVLGEFAGASRVAAALVPHFTDAGDRLQALSLLGRASGGIGDRAAFDSAADEARLLLMRSAADGVAAVSLLAFAHGAATLGDGALSLSYAERAQALATKRAQWAVAMEAEAAAAAARMKSRVRRHSEPAAPREPRPFAATLAAALSSAPVPAGV